MAKYLFHVNYTEKGLQGLLKDGGTKRRQAAKAAVESLGGTLESFYYAFGGTDLYGIGEFPDNVTTAAFSLMLTAAGGATIETTVLLTPEEVDEATKKTVNYRPPGQ